LTDDPERVRTTEPLARHCRRGRREGRELADRLELRAKAEDEINARETNPTAQITIIRDDGSSRVIPQVTVEVGDEDAVHAEAIRRGAEVVYPLTDERHGYGHRTPE